MVCCSDGWCQTRVDAWYRDNTRRCLTGKNREGGKRLAWKQTACCMVNSSAKPGNVALTLRRKGRYYSTAFFRESRIANTIRLLLAHRIKDSGGKVNENIPIPERSLRGDSIRCGAKSLFPDDDRKTNPDTARSATARVAKSPGRLGQRETCRRNTDDESAKRSGVSLRVGNWAGDIPIFVRFDAREPVWRVQCFI